jgi:hypothetical protein
MISRSYEPSPTGPPAEIALSQLRGIAKVVSKKDWEVRDKTTCSITMENIRNNALPFL